MSSEKILVLVTWLPNKVPLCLIAVPAFPDSQMQVYIEQACINAQCSLSSAKLHMHVSEGSCQKHSEQEPEQINGLVQVLHSKDAEPFGQDALPDIRCWRGAC